MIVANRAISQDMRICITPIDVLCDDKLELIPQNRAQLRLHHIAGGVRHSKIGVVKAYGGAPRKYERASQSGYPSDSRTCER